MTGEYRMTMDPSEKDALMMVPNAGLTLMEQMGMSSKADRFSRTDGTRLGTVVAAWTGHASAHALDFLEAAPDLLDDSFVLNWALVPQGEPTAPWLERRALLIGEAERRIAGRQDGVPGKE